jgi:hypothetical protein
MRMLGCNDVVDELDGVEVFDLRRAACGLELARPEDLVDESCEPAGLAVDHAEQ